ncbi:MarR family winged helix-turn-helix transcriptional regulator [Amnibacterium kyonggiense]
MNESELAEAIRGVRAVLGLISGSLVEPLEQVTMPQYRALVLLRALGPTPAGLLAERLGMQPSASSRLVGRLVRGGWIRRRTDGADRRIVVVDVTERAVALIARTRAERERLVGAALDGLGEHDRGVVLAGLTALADAVGEPEPEALIPLALDD